MRCEYCFLYLNLTKLVYSIHVYILLGCLIQDIDIDLTLLYECILVAVVNLLVFRGCLHPHLNSVEALIRGEVEFDVLNLEPGFGLQ